jgi:hypothetical protein
MSKLITRRSIVRGMFAMPAIVAFDNIMPIKVWAEPPIILPYKGISAFEAGMFYCPYIPLEMEITKVTSEGKRKLSEEWTFEQPQVAEHYISDEAVNLLATKFRTRYGITL